MNELHPRTLLPIASANFFRGIIGLCFLILFSSASRANSSFTSESKLISEVNERISFALAHSKLKLDGPNCYNSVLFSLGIAQGLYFDDFEYWAGSPLCHNVGGSTQKNDLIHIQRLDPEVNRFESVLSVS